MIALGAASVADRRTRRRGTFAFALFALAWGVNLLLANAGTVALDPVLARRLLLLSVAAILPAPYFLVELAASQDPSPDDGRVWTALRAAAVVPALAAAGALVVAPDLMFKGFNDVGYALYARWGILRPLLVVTPFFAAFGLALVSFTRAKRASPTPRTKRRASILLAGLGMYLGYAAANNLPWFVVDLLDGTGAAEALYVLLFGVLTALVVWIGVGEFRNAGTAPTPGEARRDRLVAAALLVPVAWGSVEAGVALAFLPTFKSPALWRLLGVAVVAYGFARWRVFDLPRRTRDGVATGAGAAAAGVGGAAAYAGSGLFVGGLVPPVLGVLVAGVSLIPSLRVSRSVLGPASRDETRDDQVYQKRIDSYRAAVESAMARDMAPEDRDFLEGLRDRYGITPEEDRVIRYYARNAVVGVDDGADASSYERLRLLGEGGEGRTWLARDRNRERLVVLKEPLAGPLEDPDLRDKVLDEARAARKVRHPNVVAVEEVVDGPDSPVLVMEHVEGGSLADLLEAEGPLPWDRAREILLQVLAGLEAVHGAGLVHRDIKPSNVLLTADGDARIADFGVATRRPDAVGGDTLQNPEATVGTRGYVAPEVEAGERADELADVYGAGALLHVCLTGAPPDPDEALGKPPGVPEAGEAVLARALAPEPGDRYPSVQAMRKALEGTPEGT